MDSTTPASSEPVKEMVYTDGSQTPPPPYPYPTDSISFKADDHQPAPASASSSRPPSYPSSPSNALAAATATLTGLSALFLPPPFSTSSLDDTDKQPASIRFPPSQLHSSSSLVRSFKSSTASYINRPILLIDTLYMTFLNLIGAIFILLQIIPSLLIALPPIADNKYLANFIHHFTQISWDLHDFIEEAELHPPSMWDRSRSPAIVITPSLPHSPPDVQ